MPSLLSDAGDIATIIRCLIQLSVQFMSVVCEERYFISVKKERRQVLCVAVPGRLLCPETFLIKVYFFPLREVSFGMEPI